MPATFFDEGHRILKRLIGMDPRVLEHNRKSVCLCDTDDPNPVFGILLQFDEKGFRTASLTGNANRALVFQPIEGIRWSENEFVADDFSGLVEEFLIKVMAERFEELAVSSSAGSKQ